MQYRRIKAGTTDVSVILRVVNSTSGLPDISVTYASTGIALDYKREGAIANEPITEISIAAADAHADGGFVHIGNGYCRLDLPDAACSAGATGVLVHGAITDRVVIGAYVDLVTYDSADVKTVADAIKAKTDSLSFTVAGNLDANVQYINDAAVTGNGNAEPWDGA